MLSNVDSVYVGSRRACVRVCLLACACVRACNYTQVNNLATVALCVAGLILAGMFSGGVFAILIAIFGCYKVWE